MTEYRLRVGFINYPPLFLLGPCIEQIGRISNSTEMAPWSVGGSYDRPIARRFLEESGVPGDLFGVRKQGSGWGLIKSVDDLCPSSRADFLDFLAEHPEVATPARVRASWFLFVQYSRVLSRLRPERSLAGNCIRLKRYSRPLWRTSSCTGASSGRGRYEVALGAMVSSRPGES